MDSWNSDQILYILQYLNVYDLQRFGSTARRYYYLVNEYQQLKGPELVTACSLRGENLRRIHKTQKETLQEALDRLQTQPNLALCFSRTDSSSLGQYLTDNQRRNNNNEERRLLPQSTVFLEARSSDIQSSQRYKVESDSRYLAMLAHFPNSTIQSFHFDDDAENAIEPYIEHLQRGSNNVEWKAFIIYACGEEGDASERLIARLQETYPDAIIVGGFCDEGFVTDTTTMTTATRFTRQSRWRDQLRYIVDGVFGVALGGEIPMKSVVSRGARSLFQGEPTPTSPIKVQSAEFNKATRNSHHVLRQFVDECGRVVTFHDLLEKYSQPEFVGLRRQGEDGFHIADVNPVSFNQNLVVIGAGSRDDESYLNAEIDFYDLDGDACKKDVEVKMAALKEQTKNEEILGALIFTCNGRGPSPGFLIDKEMHDAHCFSNVFPNVPCLGFYAGGEIGPEAIVARQDAFQSGNARLQGFTAVFALFIVPKVDTWVRHNLDDSPERVKQFCIDKLAAKKRLKRS